MAWFFERILTEGIAELSYLIGDDSKGVAAVIDPRADVAVYLELARKHGVAITHVFETHIHADFVSGARELADRTGTARVHACVEGDAGYGFDFEPVRDGDHFEFGDTVLTARHTPGHTPEHVSYEVAEKGRGLPFAIFTGDSLFVASAGRPDLLGEGAEQLASQLYDTLFGYFARLADGTIIYPAHGSGSPCGADIGDRLESTVGYEKRFNPYYAKTDRTAFIEHALGTAPPEPTYYKRMKKVNSVGPEVLGRLPVIPALPAAEFRKTLETGAGVLVDTRHMLAFGGGHIDGALNIGASPMLTVWAGWMLDPGQPILLVVDDDARVSKVETLFIRSGYTRFAGYLAGGMTAWDKQGFPLLALPQMRMTAWDKQGFPLLALPQMTVEEVCTCSENLQVLDVRAPAEWQGGHIPCATHIFVPEIAERHAELDKEKPTVTYCATGYRASIAASWLQQLGFRDVRTMPGSWTAWKNAGLPVSNKENGQ